MAPFYLYEKVNYEHVMIKWSLLTILLLMVANMILAIIGLENIKTANQTITDQVQLYSNLESIKDCARGADVQYVNRFDISDQISQTGAN